MVFGKKKKQNLICIIEKHFEHTAKCQIPYVLTSWIWLFLRPWAGSLIGILIVSLMLLTTIDRSDEYLVWICLSSTDQNRWKSSVFSYPNDKERERLIMSNSERNRFSHTKLEIATLTLHNVLHCVIWLVADTMIDKDQLRFRYGW